MTHYHLYGIGAALVDTEVEADDAFLAACGIEKGVMTLVDEKRQHELMGHLKPRLVGSRRASGGSAANSIIACSSFGGRAYYSCKVANDENGDFYLKDLQAAGVHSDFNGSRPEGITGKCLVMISPDAERTMNTFLGISETLSPDNLNREALKNSEWLYIEGYLVTSPTGRAAAIAARECAEQHGVRTALSFSDPGMVKFFREGLAQMIGNKVNLAFCNREEACCFAGSESINDAVDAIAEIADTFAITLGAEGAIVHDGKTLHRIAAHPVDAIDTNGAGDAFAGAFLYGITHGHSYAEAGRLASLTSARVVGQYGPRLQKNSYQALLQEFLGR